MDLQFTNQKRITICSDDSNAMTSTICVADVSKYITDVNAPVNVDHTFTSDLEISLTEPNG